MKTLIISAVICLSSGVSYANEYPTEKPVSNGGNSGGFELIKVADVPGYPRAISDGKKGGNVYVVGFVDQFNDNWPDIPEYSSRVGYRWQQETGVSWLITNSINSSEVFHVNDSGAAAAHTCGLSSCDTVIWHADNSITNLKSEVDDAIRKYLRVHDLGTDPSIYASYIDNKEKLTGMVNFYRNDQSKGTLGWTWEKNEGLTILEGDENITQGLEAAIEANDKGYSVGLSFYENIADGMFAALWNKKGDLTELPIPKSLYPYGVAATSINDKGIIVGLDQGFTQPAWTFDSKKGTFSQLEWAEGGSNEPIKITESGYVFGDIYTSAGGGVSTEEPVIWDPKGNLYYLNDYFSEDGLILGSWGNLNSDLLLVHTRKGDESSLDYRGGAVYQLRPL
jgi:hypothetical protein